MLQKGNTNCAADALSRATHARGILHAISVAVPTWLESLQNSYTDSPSATKFLAALSIQTPDGSFSLDQGFIKYKQAIWLGHSVDFQTMATDQLHSSPIGGHSGFLVTYKRIRKLFYWPHMKATIEKFVQSCVMCQ